ncbi:hypothetical protein SAMN04488595_103375 [Ralstonia sp. 25mfcol4.1]|nr:hypothetical protein SAMN04488595_103375 [Ralstonia sp. 25mfcol4.1]
MALWGNRTPPRGGAPATPMSSGLQSRAGLEQLAGQVGVLTVPARPYDGPPGRVCESATSPFRFLACTEGWVIGIRAATLPQRIAAP